MTTVTGNLSKLESDRQSAIDAANQATIELNSAELLEKQAKLISDLKHELANKTMAANGMEFSSKRWEDEAKRLREEVKALRAVAEADKAYIDYLLGPKSSSTMLGGMLFNAYDNRRIEARAAGYLEERP